MLLGDAIAARAQTVTPEQRRVFEAVLDTHQVITSDLEKNVRRLSGLCASEPAGQSGKASLPQKKQLERLDERINRQQAANRAIRGLVKELEGNKALEVSEWAERWELLQMKRLSLLREVAALEARGCVRQGFFERLFAANEALIASDPDGGLLIFEELTGLRSKPKSPEEEQQQPTLLRDLFERFFGVQPQGQPTPQRLQ